MEVRHTVRRFPSVAFALILGLAAALAVAMTLSLGGWGLAIPGASSASSAAQPAGQSAGQSHPGSPATETRPTTPAPDTTQPAGQAGVTSSSPCTWGEGCSTSP